MEGECGGWIEVPDPESLHTKLIRLGGRWGWGQYNPSPSPISSHSVSL